MRVPLPPPVERYIHLSDETADVRGQLHEQQMAIDEQLGRIAAVRAVFLQDHSELIASGELAERFPSKENYFNFWRHLAGASPSIRMIYTLPRPRPL